VCAAAISAVNAVAGCVEANREGLLLACIAEISSSSSWLRIIFALFWNTSVYEGLSIYGYGGLSICKFIILNGVLPLLVVWGIIWICAASNRK
jgi:hypothetical protein